MDSKGNFTDQRIWRYFCIPTKVHPSTFLREEITRVQKDSSKFIEELKFAPQLQIGELHPQFFSSTTPVCRDGNITFICVGSLGKVCCDKALLVEDFSQPRRDSPAAKIFLSKSEEEYQRKFVIPRYLKYVAWLIVVLVNLGFIYFSMLRALSRGLEWQVSRSAITSCWIDDLVFYFSENVFTCLYFPVYE